MKRRGQRSTSGRSLDLIPSAIEPLNKRQELAINSNKHLVLCGYAGTGKSYIACSLAFEALYKRAIDKVIIVRSSVSTRDMGFLPGNAAEKMEPFEIPYQEIASEIFSRGDAYELLKKSGKLVFMSTAFIRGLSLHNSVVIVDEFQNMNYHELDSVITRSGDNCRFIFSGDINQADIRDSGFNKFFNILESIDAVDLIDFKQEDIVRSKLVKDYIIAKTKYEQKSRTK